MTPDTRVRVSASSIKALMQCSMAYYYARVLKLPEKVWPRTVMGSLAHSIFECLRHKRHRKHYDLITSPRTHVDYELSPAVARLVRAWKVKHGISNELLADLNGMLFVGLVLVDFYWTIANKDKDGQPITHGPEHEFLLKLDDGTEIKGFIDDMGEQGDIMVIRDYKSQKKRFDEDELVNSIQAAIYQLYVWTKFGKLARVEFVLLRHPPTKRTPEKHLQIVPPCSALHMDGLVHYIKNVSAKVNQFTMEDAWTSVCTDEGFCRNVCTHYAPHPYWVVVKKGDKLETPIRSSIVESDLKDIGPDEIILAKQHNGCLSAWKG